MTVSLLQSEGWQVLKTTSRGGCVCPHCGTEVRQNAFSRKKHKDRCEGWREIKSVPMFTPVDEIKKGNSITYPDGTTGKVIGVIKIKSANPTPPPAPRLPWIEDRFGSWREWNVTYRDDQGKSLVYLRIREMAACTGSNRYSTYAGNKYVGAYSTLEIAQGSVERLVGVK